MSMTQIFLLAIIQGVTEFLPVSSSGHLNLLHGLTDLPDQGIIIDVAVHAGTLLAVMIYFRHDVLRLLHGGIEILNPQSAKKPSENKIAAIQIIIATLPILPVGALLVITGWIDLLRPEVVAWATIIFALPLFLADHFRQSNISVAATGWRGATIIGCAQIFALIPWRQSRWGDHNGSADFRMYPTGCRQIFHVIVHTCHCHFCRVGFYGFIRCR